MKEHACTADCRTYLDAIDAWCSGVRATPGLSATGERYAGSMRDHVRANVEKLRALGHYVPTDLG